MATQEQYQELISAIETNYTTLENISLESLIREKDLGNQLNFIKAQPTIIKIIDLFKKAKNVDLSEVPFKLLNQFHSALTETLEKFGEFVNFDPAQGNPVQQRDALINDLENRYDNIHKRVLDILTIGLLYSNDFSMQQAKLDNLIKDFENKKKEDDKKSKNYLGELEQTLSNAKAAAAQVGVSQHSTVFKTESDDHKKEAKKWLKWTIGILIGITLVSILALIFIPNEEANTREIIQYTLTKLVILSTMFYALSICSRNYKAHKHNSLLNQHRQNALTTFETFSKAAGPDDQTKNAVLLEATHTIFSNQQTGYLSSDKETDSSNKIIEIIKSVAKVEGK